MSEQVCKICDCRIITTVVYAQYFLPMFRYTLYLCTTSHCRHDCLTDFPLCVVIVEHSEGDRRQNTGEVKEKRGRYRLLQRLVPDKTINKVLRMKLYQ